MKRSEAMAIIREAVEEALIEADPNQADLLMGSIANVFGKIDRMIVKDFQELGGDKSYAFKMLTKVGLNTDLDKLRKSYMRKIQ